MQHTLEHFCKFWPTFQNGKHKFKDSTQKHFSNAKFVDKTSYRTAGRLLVRGKIRLQKVEHPKGRSKVK